MNFLDIDYIDLKKINQANVNGKIISFEIFPFHYTNDKNPRLPRKTSTNYNLRADTKYCFYHAFKKIKRNADNSKYKVKMIVNNGTDRLGGADLDNYCKTILDGITSTQKIWIDDRQVDELVIKRDYSSNAFSFIMLEISEI